MALDIWKNLFGGLNAPAAFAVNVTKSDSVDLPNVSRSIYIGAAGSLVFVPAGMPTTTCAYSNAVVGYHPIRASRIMATGTTADDIKAVW